MEGEKISVATIYCSWDDSFAHTMKERLEFDPLLDLHNDKPHYFFIHTDCGGGKMLLRAVSRTTWHKFTGATWFELHCQACKKIISLKTNDGGVQLRVCLRQVLLHNKQTRLHCAPIVGEANGIIIDFAPMQIRQTSGIVTPE